MAQKHVTALDLVEQLACCRASFSCVLFNCAVRLSKLASAWLGVQRKEFDQRSASNAPARARALRKSRVRARESILVGEKKKQGGKRPCTGAQLRAPFTFFLHPCSCLHARSRNAQLGATARIECMHAYAISPPRRLLIYAAAAFVRVREDVCIRSDHVGQFALG